MKNATVNKVSVKHDCMKGNIHLGDKHLRTYRRKITIEHPQKSTLPICISIIK